jgi:signal transduction histidine kinase
LINISVRDTGSGIPEEIKGKLFQMFATYDHNNGTNRHGVGLGLTIAKKLVKELGPSGEISVDTEVGLGTCFSFTLFAE